MMAHTLWFALHRPGVPLRGGRQQPTTEGGEGEQRDHQTGCQPHPATQHATNPGRRLVLADDLDLVVLAPLDHRRVVRVDQPSLTMQVLDQVVVGVRAVDIRVHPDIDHERFRRHHSPPDPVPCQPRGEPARRWSPTTGGIAPGPDRNRPAHAPAAPFVPHTDSQPGAAYRSAASRRSPADRHRAPVDLHSPDSSDARNPVDDDDQPPRTQRNRGAMRTEPVRPEDRAAP